MRLILTISILVWVVSIQPGDAQTERKPSKQKMEVMGSLDNKTSEYGSAAMKIWNYAELGYQEQKSSKLLQEMLRDAGFEVEAGVAGMPTSFVAAYGSGNPVIGILAEFDALPGVSQEAVPYQKEREDGVTSGHACGHHLFGTGGSAAAIAVKSWLETTGSSGTIRVYGTPAEEGGSGKVYMVREGLFDDVDVAMYWHAGSSNEVRARSNLAIASMKFRFHGVAAHAAAAPDRGRSALDGVESMNYMVNLMREHVPSEARIHYIITRGGEAPNVVPAFAEVYYYIRHPDMRQVKQIMARVIDAAEGAAQGTGTTMDYEVTGGSFNVLPNETLARAMQVNLEMVGGVEYTPEEKAFAEQIMTTFPSEYLRPEDAAKVEPLNITTVAQNSSTDSGDVSWVVPLISMSGAAYVPGTAGHSWQAIAAGGTGIGIKGMMVSAKTLALTAIDIYKNPKIAEEARAELEKRRGAGYVYESLVGDRDPALDYRK